jgi:hypothetical protein
MEREREKKREERRNQGRQLWWPKQAAIAACLFYE